MSVLNTGEVYAKQTRYLMAKAREHNGAGPLWVFESSADLPAGTIRVEGQTVWWSIDVRDAITDYERRTMQYRGLTKTPAVAMTDTD